MFCFFLFGLGQEVSNPVLGDPRCHAGYWSFPYTHRSWSKVIRSVVCSQGWSQERFLYITTFIKSVDRKCETNIPPLGIVSFSWRNYVAAWQNPSHDQTLYYIDIIYIYKILKTFLNRNLTFACLSTRSQVLKIAFQFHWKACSYPTIKTQLTR